MLNQQKKTSGLLCMTFIAFLSCVSSSHLLAEPTECNSPGACVETKTDDPFKQNPFTLPESVEGAWDNYRTKWSRITGFELSGLHWQQFVIVYMNKGRDIYKRNYGEYVRFYVDEDDDEDAEFEMYEPGTIFIKENYLAHEGSVGKPLTLTTMVKREPGFDPEHNDWEYIQSSLSGKILLQGSAQDPSVKAVCAECHSNIADRDYIFSSFYSE